METYSFVDRNRVTKLGFKARSLNFRNAFSLFYFEMISRHYKLSQRVRSLRNFSSQLLLVSQNSMYNLLKFKYQAKRKNENVTVS